MSDDHGPVFDGWQYGSAQRRSCRSCSHAPWPPPPPSAASTNDVDGEARSEAPDIGADERSESAPASVASISVSGGGSALASDQMWRQIELTTNNRMELLSVTIALENLKKEELEVVIYSDSKYALNLFAKREEIIIK